MIKRVRSAFEPLLALCEKSNTQDKLLLLLAAFLIFLPLVKPFGAELGWFAQWGAWLQGALTPLLLFMAIVSYKTQAESQNKSNMTASRALFVSNIEAFHRQIRVRCVACLIGEEPTSKPLIGKEPTSKPGSYADDDRALNDMMTMLSSKFGHFVTFDVGEGMHTQYLPRVQPTTRYRLLCESVNEVVALAKEVNLEPLLDDRISAIHKLIVVHPPLPPKPDEGP